MRYYYGNRAGGHLPSDLRGVFADAKEAFDDWDGHGPEPTVEFARSDPPRRITLSEACGLVWNCTDVLPESAASDLQEIMEGSRGTTYAAAARAMKRWIDERK